MGGGDKIAMPIKGVGGNWGSCVCDPSNTRSWMLNSQFHLQSDPRFFENLVICSILLQEITGGA